MTATTTWAAVGGGREFEDILYCNARCSVTGCSVLLSVGFKAAQSQTSKLASTAPWRSLPRLHLIQSTSLVAWSSAMYRRAAACVALLALAVLASAQDAKVSLFGFLQSLVTT